MLPIAVVARSSSGRVTKSQGEGAVLGVGRAIQKHWQPSLQSTLPCSLQKDHSIANNVMQQKGSFSMPGKRN